MDGPRAERERRLERARIARTAANDAGMRSQRSIRTYKRIDREVGKAVADDHNDYPLR